MIINISESQLNRLFMINEDVFVNKIKGKKANLTYNQRQNSNPTRNKGNLDPSDMLNTGKMDQNNHDTFIVPLKGGINSYNITSIRGMEVMHYFKNKVDKKKTNIDININGVKSEYELFMDDPEFQKFISTFINKVDAVVNYAISQFDNKAEFTGISIYPVPSSSHFNETMCKAIAGNAQIAGLPTQAITDTLFKKDLSNLQKDKDFINKNKDYYSGRMYKNGENDVTHEEWVDDTIRKYKNMTAAQDQTLIDNYNLWIRKIVNSYHNHVSQKKLAANYVQLVNAHQAIRQKLKSNKWNKSFKEIKYAKGPSVEKRSQEIWAAVEPILGKTYVRQNQIPIVEITKINFQMKNLTNDTRMGLKNFFQLSKDTALDIKKIQNTVFVIFDDNISGGATLSDICYQCKKLGINYIVPITFGVMNTKYNVGVMHVNEPQGGFNY